MKIENSKFWNIQKVIQSQDKSVEYTNGYEKFLYEKVAQYAERQKILIEKVKVFGCGTGREIKGILSALSVKTIKASDISENMIDRAKNHIKTWGIEDKVSLLTADAVTFKDVPESYDLVTLMSCMLTYVPEKKDRYSVFKTSYDILKKGGCVIGVVHNQVGTPQKTLFFWCRRILKPFLKHEVGYRIAGFYGYDVPGYYFSKKELKQHLAENGFESIEITSLSEFYKSINYNYNRLKGYNNLLFFATKPTK